MTNTPATFKLHSPEQVREMFPDGRKPELRNIIRKAKDLGCCCKLGRGVGFTDEQVAQFFQAITEAQAEGDTTLTAALRTMVTTVTVHRNYELEITGNLAPLTRGEEMVAGERLDCFPPATLVIPFIIKAAA